MTADERRHVIRVDALSRADELGYRGQCAVAEAVAGRGDYRLVGGHMVRLLLLRYPTRHAVPRSTIDADAALSDVQVVGDVVESLLADGFVKAGGNIFLKELATERVVEVNLLLPRTSGLGGVRPRSVEGVGRVDSLHELTFAMLHPAMVLDVEARLDDELLEYRVRIPDLEVATVLKAHAWKHRGAAKDLADLQTLLEIRDAHPETVWALQGPQLIGFRRDTARILQELRRRLSTRAAAGSLSPPVDRLRLAALIQKHVGPA